MPNKIPKKQLVATIYHQPKGSDPDEDDAVEYQFFKWDKGYFLATDMVDGVVKDYKECPSIETLQKDAAEDWEK